MRVPYWLNFLSSRRRAGPSRPAAAPRRARPFRPTFEALEDRFVPSFSPAVAYAAGSTPQAVVTADFNGDHRLDLAVANYSGTTVSVLLGNADGTFRPAQDSATGAFPHSLAVGDFNADGKLDLATASPYGVSVLLGNGNGTFGGPTTIDLYGTSPASVAVGDFNADGKLDLGRRTSITAAARFITVRIGQYRRPGERAEDRHRSLGTDRVLPRLRASRVRGRGRLQRRRQTRLRLVLLRLWGGS